MCEVIVAWECVFVHFCHYLSAYCTCHPESRATAQRVGALCACTHATLRPKILQACLLLLLLALWQLKFPLPLPLKQALV